MTNHNTHNPYKEAGVDVEKGDQLVDWLKSDSSPITSKRGHIVDSLGGFAGLFRPDWKSFEDPLIVSCTDGVGTKVLLAVQQNKLEGLGIDLVAMCVNDLYCMGAEPLFFLDYFATGKLDDQQFRTILTSIKCGLRQCHAPLLGGETAELPGMYQKDDFDLAGFVVGIVDRPKMLNPANVTAGDKIYGLRSSGFHSNGYSLIRKWIAENPVDASMIGRLLEPTAIYAEIPGLLADLPQGIVKSAAHITGGGISGNLPRALANGTHAVVYERNIPTPDWMQKFLYMNGRSPIEMESTFNIGLGMCLIVDSNRTAEFERRATMCERLVGPIGHIESSAQSDEPSVVFQ